MQLVRFAYLDPPEALDAPTRFAFSDVQILTWGDPGARPRLVSASHALAERPAVADGIVAVPADSRRRTERALEMTAGLLSIARGTRILLSSPNLPVAFRADSAEDRKWLASHREIEGFSRAITEPDFALGVELALAAELGDRLDGVALLAEAVSSDRMLGRFREAVRVFERAFATSSDRLVPTLADFLEQRPALGYSKTEVKNWISRIRGRVVHADRHKREPALEADVRPFVSRMLLAAYEVVLNKADWGNRSTSRRQLWTPRAGARDPLGRSVFIEQHALEPPIQGRLFDRFGAYPLHLGATSLSLPDDYWPSTGPAKTNTEQFGLSVIPRADLEALRIVK